MATRSMNLDNFVANLKFGGARPNLFVVSGAFPSGISVDRQKMEFHIKAASLPAYNLGSIILPFRGRQAKIPGDRTFDPWNITVINEADFNLRAAFEQWSNIINNLRTNVSSQLYSQYATDWTVTQLDRTGADIRTYKLIKCWPSQVSPINLSFDATDQVEEFDVTLEYQEFQIPSGTNIPAATL